MNQLVIIPNEFPVSAQELRFLWNQSTEQFKLEPHKQPIGLRYSPDLAISVLSVLGSVSTSVASKFLYDAIKKLLNRKEKEKVQYEIQDISGEEPGFILILKKKS